MTLVSLGQMQCMSANEDKGLLIFTVTCDDKGIQTATQMGANPISLPLKIILWARVRQKGCYLHTVMFKKEEKRK